MTKEQQPFIFTSPKGITFVSRTPAQLEFVPFPLRDEEFDLVPIPVGPWDKTVNWTKEAEKLLGQELNLEGYSLDL